MNLVDLIGGQLSSGDVLGKLGGLIGANESQTKSATSAAVPALLNVFSKLASTNSGADQLAKAMGGLDLGMLGNLAGALGGSQASGLGSLGGNLLGSLLGGGNNLQSLVGALASFAGMQPGIMKTLLTYLAPIVLGMVAKQFTGKPDAAGISRLFSEQSANIRGGLPKGFSLPDLALGAVSGGRPSEPARSHGHAHAEEKAGMPSWLLPLLVLGALGVGYYLWNQNQKKAGDGAVAVREDVVKDGPVVVDRTEVIEKAGKDLVDTVTETIAIDPRFLEAGKVAGGLFTGLTKTLAGVTDEASAKAALPEFEKFGPLLTTLETEAGKLPADEKPAFTKVIADNLGLLGKIIEKVMAIPGVKDVLGPVVTPMIETLTKMSK
ncbi:MAG: DUF937 domain-containing protein [Planctomycetaceae bacterium]|jgi:hypothetical protein|nr:DUF937 domain-containing protein [Planctomycetaceae bacterium]